ncbi:hemerythrin domain-containing protein [Georgenia sp. SYP-B2076]|uniref:hemerythrin domain-containing protein n=1 Tax=Georgenia sp. SYP-B2076 TaxID=2495881 RepID=UPI000F8CB35B|nr:hemerythrin domain-containing protein [Georgenia sp. SYP-B2076]
MADIVDVIKAQHREVEKLLEKAEEGGPAAAGFLQQVNDLLKPHSEAEESFVYPTIRERREDEADQVHDSVAEHHHIEELLEELVSTDPETPGYDGKLAALVGELSHHVEEEEQDLLPVLAKVLSAEEREEMGQRFARETGAGDRPAAAATEAGGKEPTKEELYEKAQEQDVPGRSSMTKDELKDAVQSD